MKKTPFFALLVLAAALLMPGCKQEPGFEKNSEIPYVRYVYDRANGTFQGPLRNLTETGAVIERKDADVLVYRDQTLTKESVENANFSRNSFGTVILHSPEEVEALLQKPLEKADTTESGFSPRDLFWLEDQTKDFSFDEAFFAEYDLLAVDLCCYYAITFPARPEDFTAKDGDVWLTVRYGCRDAVTADHCGTLILIPVPKGSQHAEVTYEYMKSWE